MKYFLFVFAFLNCIIINAQNPYSINYTISDGLPSNNIYSIFQDDEGFLWFTTDVGVVKYDSHTFKLLSSDDGLSDNEVFQIKKDYLGRKWLLTLNGTPSIIKNDSVFNETNSKLLKSIKSKSMLVDFYEDRNQTIYLSSRKGEITSLNKNNEILKTYIDKTTVFGVWSNNEDAFALTANGIYNLSKNTFLTKQIYPTTSRLFHTEQESYISVENILYKINSDNSFTKLIELDESTEIINLYKEDENTFWICTRQGLYLFKNQIKIDTYFEDCTVSDILKDNEGNYWVSTLNKGLLFVPSFEVIVLQNANKEKIKINCITVRSINEVWFGGTVNDYYIKKNKRFIKKNLNTSWRKDNITNIRFFENDAYVLGKAGVLKVTNTNKKEFPFYANDLLINDETIYLATTFTTKFKLKTIEQNPNLSLNNGLFFRSRTNVLKLGNKNTIWLGSSSGLYNYTIKDSIQYYGNYYSALQGSINDLHYGDNKNRLIVASASKGILVLENDKLIHSISYKNNLNNNTVNTIEKISANNFLIGTNKGLNQLVFKNNTIKLYNYNSAFAFKNTKINDIAFVNDTIYLATDKELIYFNKTYLNQKKTSPKCIINGLYTNTEKIINNNLNSINYNTNNVSVSFTGISYLDQGNLRYYYKLSNTDKQWSTTLETQINYKALSPKSYTFNVYSKNGFGEKSDIATISFTIKKPFWQQWWFVFLAIGILFSVIYMLWKWRLKHLNRKFEKERKAMFLENENIALENQMLALEQKALRLQMNPHFIFNALNTIKGYYSEGNIREASDYISKFSKLLRLLLENIEQFIPLSLEIEMLSLYLELAKVRYQDKFDYDITVEDELNTSEINVPTLLLQPLVENAIIHGIAPKKKKGKIEISFKIKNNQLVCAVKDNGVGRHVSKKTQYKEYESKAIDITKERLQLIEIQENMSCSLQFFDYENEGNSKGTKVEIVIPIIKK